MEIMEKWGADRFVSPLLSPSSTHPSLILLFLVIIGFCFLCQLLFLQMVPVKFALSYIYQLFHVVCYLLLLYPPSTLIYKRAFNWWAVLPCNYLRCIFCCSCGKLPFIKVCISSLLAYYNLQQHANSHAKSINPQLTWLVSIFPISSFSPYLLHYLEQRCPGSNFVRRGACVI